MPSDQTDEFTAAFNAHLLISKLEGNNQAEPPKSEATVSPPPATGKGGGNDITKQSKETNKKAKSKVKAKPIETQPRTETPKSTYDRWSLADELTINYGWYGDRKYFASESSAEKDRFYITTAINYTNGPAHMGHAYEATTADAIARFSRLSRGNENTYFLTGSDEHGQKIANTAIDQDVKPIDLCNKYVIGFQCLNQRILISNNDYIRTTSQRHKKTAQALWSKCAKTLQPNGESDIYCSKYSGWYNEREETFVTDSDAKLADYKDETSGKPLKKVEEESYFFRMSAYHQKLVEYINDHPEFIQPAQYKNLILSRLNADELRDLSISRTTFDWGIPVPDGFNAKHVMYVWFDALTNYLTGINGLGVNEEDTEKGDLHQTFWPANVHIIGKDILWFHTVIWPCILMSAGIPLPKTVFAHGFVNDKEGKKMSKSLGNVVDPHDLLDKYSVDTFRWYLCKEAPYGGELAFNEDSLIDMHNADLCDTLGNLIHRATNLCKKYCGGVIPDVDPPSKPPCDFAAIRELFLAKMNDYELEKGAAIAIQGFGDVNGFLTEQAPWLMKGDERAEERRVIVRATLEAVFALAHLLLPFLPTGGAKIFEKIGTPPVLISEVRSDLRNLKAGTKVQIGDVLYSKIISEEEKKTESHAEAQKRKKEIKANAVKNSKAGMGNNVDPNQPEFTKMDIRVGLIQKIWNHPEADKLFCEEIDVGEDAPRQIASGLREHYTLDDMQNQKVLVVCNLKPSKILGFSSNGMVLAAKNDNSSKVELIKPPEAAAVGERVFIDGLTGEPISSAQVKRKKVWETVAKGLKTADGGVATWDSKEIKTSAGVCIAESLAGAPIS